MLDYLFIAETHNGQLIQQTQEDVSRIDPTKSAFFDILQNHIKKFSLVGHGHMFTIDLTDGHLEVNGHSLYPPKEIATGAVLRPIYYRQVQQTMDAGKQQKPTVSYFLGWQYTDKGKNHEWQMKVE